MAEKLFHVNYVCGLKVSVEKFKAPNGSPQCHRCQSFGHVDKACFMQPKCVKCGNQHLTKDCKKGTHEPA